MFLISNTHYAQLLQLAPLQVLLADAQGNEVGGEEGSEKSKTSFISEPGIFCGGELTAWSVNLNGEKHTSFFTQLHLM